MTKRLYLDDQYLRTFSSAVIQKVEARQRAGIILEQTLFYPASGGQPHDTGTINEIPVIDVLEDADHKIIHLLAEPVAQKSVKGRINWERRFDHMQQHTGQHLLSQVFLKLCQAQTISFHLGDKSATLDVNQAGLSIESMAAVEEFANQIIYENRSVMGHIIGKNELNQYPVLKKQYFDYEVKSLMSECHEVKNINIIAKTFEDRHSKELKILAQKVLKNSPNTVILFGSKAAGKAALFFLRSAELDCDMEKLMQNACAVIKGRGGGRPQQAQGGGSAVDKLDAALQCAYELISKR